MINKITLRIHFPESEAYISVASVVSDNDCHDDSASHGFNLTAMAAGQ